MKIFWEKQLIKMKRPEEKQYICEEQNSSWKYQYRKYLEMSEWNGLFLAWEKKEQKI